LISREGVFKNIALDFSCAGRGLLVYENHSARDFEAGQVLAAEIDDPPFRRLLPGFQLDKNRDDFHI
jgi:hypothetical protein